ncbi:aminodeoxychorismate/anthranilate synthase component II [Photobacterium damselae]|nr:aminodeoxychorismate/anthranilate synthase component II [Photobacterium damselae]
MNNTHIVLLDNYDSFTYNLVDQFRSLGHSVTVFRNSADAYRLAQHIQALPNAVLVLSPGPGAPNDAGCMPHLIELMKGKVPILGICLGHQAIVESYGGTVAGAGEIMHGKADMLEHNGHRIFGDLPSSFPIARYHSLVATQVIEPLHVIAKANQLIMAVVHEQDKVCGFQFHPESILTTQGAQLLAQTLDWISRPATPLDLTTPAQNQG